jgi:hypothetical protein
VVVIPNLIFIGALLMLLAALTRSMLMVYLGVIGFFVLWSFAGYLTRDINNDFVAAMVEPFGLRAMARMTRYWTMAERNVQLPAIDGMLLWNRVLWIANRPGADDADRGAVQADAERDRAALVRARREGASRQAPAAAVHVPAARVAAAAPRASQRFDAGASLAPVPGAVALRHQGRAPWRRVRRDARVRRASTCGLAVPVGRDRSAPRCCRSRT